MEGGSSQKRGTVRLMMGALGALSARSDSDGNRRSYLSEGIRDSTMLVSGYHFYRVRLSRV
ncbi:hypothetical protein QBD00_003174 [Ochrobactrum sp. AN78]|nr:hypothetical protein [Ochrobactrum sp. AN78]